MQINITKNKKGYALIYVMCVLLILTSFTLAILTVAASNRLTTANLNNNNKAHLAAEAGMDAAVGYFKNYVSTNYNEYFDRKNSTTPDDYHIRPGITDYSTTSTTNVYTSPTVTCDDGSSYSYTLSFHGGATDTADLTETKDAATGNNVRCLVINSTGTFNHVTKTIKASVDENEISNIYQDKMFTKPINVDSKIPEVNTNNMTYGKEFVPLTSLTPSTIPMVIYKRKNSDTSTLKQLTDEMYTHINQPGTEIYNQLNSITPDIEGGLLGAGTPLNDKVSSYINSISSTGDGKNNKINDMLKYARINKVLMIDGDLDVGIMTEPLVSYVIYCTGDVRFTKDSNLKLWNCNIYAKNIVYKDEITSAYNPITFDYKKNDVDVSSIKDNKGNILDNTIIDVKGITSTDAKATILQYLMASYPNAGADSPYADYYNNQTQNGSLPSSNVTAVFPSDSAAEFNSIERETANSEFNKNLDGYAYGLKLRYIYWKEN